MMESQSDVSAADDSSSVDKSVVVEEEDDLDSDSPSSVHSEQGLDNFVHPAENLYLLQKLLERFKKMSVKHLTYYDGYKLAEVLTFNQYYNDTLERLTGNNKKAPINMKNNLTISTESTLNIKRTDKKDKKKRK